jgi:hypothetical protein
LTAVIPETNGSVNVVSIMTKRSILLRWCRRWPWHYLIQHLIHTSIQEIQPIVSLTSIVEVVTSPKGSAGTNQLDLLALLSSEEGEAREPCAAELIAGIPAAMRRSSNSFPAPMYVFVKRIAGQGDDVLL